MSSWGPAISSNDTYADIYGAFFELYDEGMNVIEISEKLMSDNSDTVADKYDSHNFGLLLRKLNGNANNLMKPYLIE